MKATLLMIRYLTRQTTFLAELHGRLLALAQSRGVEVLQQSPSAWCRTALTPLLHVHMVCRMSATLQSQANE